MAVIIDSNNERTTVQVGDFISQKLYTDTCVWEVVKTTEKTITLRSTKLGQVIRKECVSGHPYPVVHFAVEPDPNGHVKVLRERTSVRPGYFAIYPGDPVTVVQGEPTAIVDYRY